MYENKTDSLYQPNIITKFAPNFHFPHHSSFPSSKGSQSHGSVQAFLVLQLLQGLYYCFPAISLLVRTGGRPGAGGKEIKAKAN